MPAEVKKGTELRERYVISDLIGVGGFATVWRATDKVAGRDVALKRLLKLSGNDLPRLLDEGRKTAKLKGHRNIVEVHEVFELDGEGFLVACRSEFVTADAAGGVRVLPLDGPSSGGVGGDIAAELAS